MLALHIDNKEVETVFVTKFNRSCTYDLNSGH